MQFHSAPLRLSRADFHLAGEAEPAGSATEASLVRIFTEVLGVEDIGVNDDFFALGGDSVAGVDLVESIEKHLDVVLPVSVLVEASTPRALAGLAGDKRTQETRRSLVPVRTAGKGAPLICVHGLPGNVVFVRTFAKKLHTDQPVFGLRAAGFQPDELPVGTMREIVRNYVAEIEAALPEGPLWMMGYCGGSWIALEIAERLRRSGRTVPGLIMVDPSALKLLSRARIGAPFRWVRARARTACIRLASRLIHDGTRRRRFVRLALHDAFDTYAPPSVRGPVLFVQSSQFRQKSEKYPSFDVPCLREADVTFKEITTTHKDMLLRHVDQVADAVQSFVERRAPE